MLATTNVVFTLLCIAAVILAMGATVRVLRRAKEEATGRPCDADPVVLNSRRRLEHQMRLEAHAARAHTGQHV